MRLTLLGHFYTSFHMMHLFVIVCSANHLRSLMYASMQIVQIVGECVYNKLSGQSNLCKFAGYSDVATTNCRSRLIGAIFLW